MAIYTKTGDNGTTSLASGERVTKTDLRIEAYGTVDELNSWIGLLRADVKQSSENVQLADKQLQWIQNKLFNLGAALSEAQGEWVSEKEVKQLEEWIDSLQTVTPKQHAFVLPAGSSLVAQCHVCRTVCRRAERCIINSKAAAVELHFINRLSDYLFVLSRYIAYCQNEKEDIWNPA